MTTSTNNPTYGLFVGVDIAATSAKVSWLIPREAPSRAISMEQTPQAFSALELRLLSMGHPASSILVVMEATGSYWISLATAMTRAGFAVSVINPAQAHHFAKALLKRAKTDAIDAQTLAQLACLLQPTPWTPPPPVYAELQQRLAQRDSLLELRQQVRNQLHALNQMPTVIAMVRTRMEQLIETLTGQLAQVDAEIEATLESDVSLRRLCTTAADHHRHWASGGCLEARSRPSTSRSVRAPKR
jgi:transposase